MDPQLPTLVRPIDHGDPLLWVGLFTILGSVYMVARLVTWLGVGVALLPWRRTRGEHWTLRARLAWPGRRVGARAFIAVIPLIIVVGLDGRRIDLLPAVVTNFLLVAAAWTGALESQVRWARRINPAMGLLTPRFWRAAWISHLSLSGALILFAFVLVGLVPNDGGAAAWGIIAVGIVAVGAYLTWGWMAVMQGTGIIRPASERLRAIVSHVSEQMNIRPRAVHTVGLPMANALAFIAVRSVGATDAALEVLSDDELAAVCAHELGHLSEPAWVRAARFLNNVLIGVLVAMPAMLRLLPVGPDPGAIIVPLLVLCAAVVLLAGLILHLRLYRRMEVRADALGRQFEPAPGVYARALEKIYETNLVPVVIASGRQTHPELYDRMVKSGATPEYPRPAAPPAWPYYLGMLTAIAAMIAGGIGLDWLARALAEW